MTGTSRGSSGGRGRSPVTLPPLSPLPTAAERAAELIREHIFNGEFTPGTQLPETALAQALQVSRNTVRDAFRMLMNDHLLSYEMHRGVTVRSLGVDDLHDIFRLRRTLEVAAVDQLAQADHTDHTDQADRIDPDSVQHAGPGRGLDGLERAVSAGERAERKRRWQEVGTQNLRFHAELVAVLESPRADQFFKQLMTELRLGLLAVPDAEALHRPFLGWNRAILDLLADRRYEPARVELRRYLDDAEQQIVAAVS